METFEEMDEKYANYLLRQAKSNEIHAALMGGKKAEKLNKVAKAMRSEAMSIMDRLTGYKDDDEVISDEDLLKELGEL